MQGERVQRENWGTRFGFLMAAAGSAVGLGNIWRFPYLTGENGGSAFIIIYLISILVVGLSIMIAEFAVGRKTSLAAVGAYKSQNRSWTFAGVLGVLSAFFIMGFYPVVGGWSLAYMLKSVTGLLAAPEAIGDVFGAFISAPVEPLVWTLLYMVLNVVIVARGIAGGIEKASTVLMPTLFVLLIIIIFKGVSLPGAAAGLAYLFKPDWSEVSGATLLAALGQSFFTLSLGMGCMITYGSYLKKDENIPSNAVTVVSLDTLVAIMAGLAMFPAMFAFGLEPDAGPGLVFVVVPAIFAHMGAIGPLMSVIFFAALTIAALTSSISLLEVVVAYLIDEQNLDRKPATWFTAGVMTVFCTLSSLSMGVMSGVTVFGVGFFDLFDILTDKIFLGIGGMLLAIFVGWFMKKEDLKNEITNDGTVSFGLFEVWYNVIKYVIPVAIFIVAVMGIIDIPQRGLMLFGLAIIAALMAFSKKL
ncbi:MAG: sodium-dependent transporter [Firmicutes bacterium]|nr:sodium-dependent transporter [Bacillota bacterium]